MAIDWKIIKWGIIGLIAGGAICSVGLAWPHDAEHKTDWIGEDGIKNADGVLCCGSSDCAEILESDYRDEKDGVHIHVRAHKVEPDCSAYGCTKGEPAEEWDEIWAYKDIIPNPRNGKTFRCGWPTQKDRKCLIHGMPGS